MKKLILIDGNSLMYKAFFAMTPMINTKGLHTNAIYGFARMINSVVKNDYDNILVAFDAGKKTIRHELSSDYKAGRKPMPDEMRGQIPYIKKFLEVMNIKTYEQELLEADDIIGTLAKEAEDNGINVNIYSSDKDLLQLLSSTTKVILTKKGMSDLEEYTPEYFFEKYEINSNQFIDLKALMGDKSDNIKGVPGIGEKTGIKLIKDYHDVDGIIKNVEDIKGAIKDKIKDNIDVLKTSRQMVTIITDANLNVSLDDTVKKEIDVEKLIDLYNELGFNSLLKELNNNKQEEVKQQRNLFDEEELSYEVIKKEEDLKDVLINNSSILLEISEENYHRAPILVVALKNDKGDFVIDNSLLSSNVLKDYLEDETKIKFTYNLKQNIVLLKKHNLDLKGVNFDLLLATYILNSLVAKEEFKQIAAYYDYHNMDFEESVYGKGAKKSIPSLDKLQEHAINKVKAVHALKDEIIDKLKENNQYELLISLEIPLARSLAKMEFLGISIDMDELNKQKTNLKERIDLIEKKVYLITDDKFNIASPKQLGNVLFEKLAIPYPKTKKKDSYSTDIEVLEAILNLHPIVPLIIEYRQLTKLYSTYIEGLEKEIYEDNKVHTIYKQALTQTGRLSSIEPNLQNIPIRTNEGKQIRKMFIPTDNNNVFFAADYSQIELRVLAHMANVTPLVEAFSNNEDIHVKTAKLILDKENITPEDRHKAKAVNFGIIYGMSPYGLSKDLDISLFQAKNFIEKYKEVYPQIDVFMDENINYCKEFGYVKTLLNRTRIIPNINSSMHMLKEFAKRMAMNTPIQGSAADIIKIAMINIDKEMEDKNLKSTMLLQVHDELVFEIVKGEEDLMKDLVVRNMQEAVKLIVPLKVDCSYGKNWYEVK